MTLIKSFLHGQFCWAELVAHNSREAIAFYRTVLGWSTADLDESCDDHLPHIQFERNGQPVAGLIQMADELRQAKLPSVWNTYVCVDDLDQSLAKTEQLGGKVTCPAMDAGEHGRIGFVASPAGSVLGLWQRGVHGGQVVQAEVNSVCWNELTTKDAAADKAFYGALLNWSFEPYEESPTPYDVIKSTSAEQLGGIMQMSPEWGDVPSHWTVYFQVDAVDAVAASCQRCGGSLVVAPFDTPVGRIAVLADDQGAGFNIIRMEPTAT